VPLYFLLRISLILFLVFFQKNTFAKSFHSSGQSSELEGGYRYNEEKEYGSAKKVRTESACPEHLIEKINKDATSSIRNWNLTKEGSYDDFCGKSVRYLSKETNSTQLSKSLSGHNLTKLGNNQEHLNLQCLNYIDDPKRENFLIAEYYSNMARLKVGALASLESLQAIDSVLGESSLDDQNCSSLVHKMAQSGCEKLKVCKPQGGLEKQVKELEEIYPGYINLKKEVDDLRSQKTTSILASNPVTLSQPSRNLENVERGTKITEKLKQIEFLEAMYPALKGKVFNATFNQSKNNFKEALVNQLKETRKVISGELKELQGATECMNGHTSMCGRFDEVLKKLPPLDIKAFNNGASLTQEDAQVQTHLIAADCFQKVRKAGDNQSDAISGFAVNAGLVVLTMGLSSYASYGRMAFLAARQSKLAAEVAAVMPQVASRAKIASQAALSFDIFSLGKGGLDAYQKCSKDLNKLTDSGLNKDHLSKDVACAENPEQSSQAQLVADYRACVIHSVFAGASNVLLPKPVKKALEGRFKGLTKGVKKGLGESGRMKEIEE
jgi:hypothetical protein